MSIEMTESLLKHDKKTVKKAALKEESSDDCRTQTETVWICYVMR